MTIRVENLSKSFEQPDSSELQVLNDVSFTVEDGSFTTIMGPSGCGKSTLLNILAGLVRKDEGRISQDGESVTPSDLEFAYIFQEPRLLNWRTVGENLEFVLDAQGIPEEEHDERIEETLSMVGLAENRDNYPLQLSGGMRQRVGIARALVVEPEILLMDEPFSELDELTARQLRSDVIDLWQETDKTIVFVTHDISEAVYLSDEILFLDDEGAVFNRAEINFERPRDFEDAELLRRETELMDTFFGHLEDVASAR